MSNIIPFVCPFCGYGGPLELMGADRFPILQQLQVIGAGRRAARCPKCESTDKERLVFLFLKDIVRTEKLRQASILHIAPEPNLQKWLQSISSKYIAGDAFLQNQKFIGDVRYVDICSTKFENNEFDYIICNHVICDIKNDIKALNELYRILNYNGIAILQVPVTKLANTVEYDNVQTKEEREIAYGYGYHERIYNDKDYIRLLGETGFEVEVCNYYKDFGLYGLNEKEDLYVCKKLIS